MTTEIFWNDGSLDKIYLSYSEQDYNTVCTITSDQNLHQTRSTTITFTTTNSNPTIATLTLLQEEMSGIVITRNDIVITNNNITSVYK